MPRLDAASFESIRAELSRAVRAIEPPAEVLVWDAARRLLLGDAPLDDFLRLPVDDIEGATLSEVRAWRNAVFAQANATVAAAGVAPAADVAAAVDTLLESLPEFPAGEPAGAPQPAYGGRTVLIVGARRGELSDRGLRAAALGRGARGRAQRAGARGARPPYRARAAPGVR